MSTNFIFLFLRYVFTLCYFYGNIYSVKNGFFILTRFIFNKKVKYMNKKIDERDRQIIELFRQGKTYKQIAEVLFYNEATIYIRIKKMKDAVVGE